MRFYDSVGGLQDLNKMLASVLSGMGLDGEEVKDIITDPGLQSLLMALGLPEKEALKLVESDDFQLKPLYMSILTDAKRIGLAALEWVKTNGLEFIDKFCAAAQLASKSTNKKVNAVGKLGSSLCLTDKAISRLPKLEAHIRKLQETKASGAASSAVGTQPSSSSSKEIKPIEVSNIKIEDAYKHTYQYHSRIRARGVQDPSAHNFPYSFDDHILKVKPVVQNDGSLLYKMPGNLGNKKGYYEIALNPDTKTIFHRTFIPE